MNAQSEIQTPHPAEIAALLRGETETISTWNERCDSRRLAALQVTVIVVGTSLYGATTGWWRDSQQAHYHSGPWPALAQPSGFSD